jgi:hypothetical protein
MKMENEKFEFEKRAEYECLQHLAGRAIFDMHHGLSHIQRTKDGTQTAAIHCLDDVACSYFLIEAMYAKKVISEREFANVTEPLKDIVYIEFEMLEKRAENYSLHYPGEEAKRKEDILNGHTAKMLKMLHEYLNKE